MAKHEARRISGDLTPEVVRSLAAGDQVLYTGTILTARDAAHKRLTDEIELGNELPIELEGAIVYYAGPAPAKPGYPIGPVGPTSSYRMDPYAPLLLDRGQRAMIGKGARSQQVIDAVVRNQAIYFAAIGGAAALIAQSVKSSEVVAYDDLGTEAIRRLEVEDMPLTVAIDCNGKSIYETGPAEYLASIG